MSFRARLLLACVPLALAPLVVFGLRARAEVADQLGAQHRERVAALADVIEEELEREAAEVGARLDRLAEAMAADNRLRRAVLDRNGVERAYLLEYAAAAMPVAGLDLLRLQDAEGRVLSSGHFRNEYDTRDPELATAVEDAKGGGVLVSLPTASGSLLGLARARSVGVGARTVTIVGGTAVDDRFLDRLAGGTGLEVRLLTPSTDASGAADDTQGAADEKQGRVGDAEGGSGDPGAPTREVRVPFAGEEANGTARFVVRASAAPLDALLGEMDRWLLATLAAAGALALLLAIVAADRLGRPLAELARQAGRLDLDRLDVDFPTGRADELGTLSRVLDRMTRRLRASAARLREAERRATIGDIARQVNHDLRNGLIPIRNVLDHLAGLARSRPEEVATVFLDRQGTLDASLEYLDSLAANYARLSTRPDRRPCDLNAVARRVVDDLSGTGAEGDGRGEGGEDGGRDGGEGDRLEADLAPDLPPVRADPVALRRILENLVVNALESLDGTGGRVVVWSRREEDADPPRIAFGVTDTGPGIPAGERDRIFDDFYTTKPEGGGLGLSIVRRLVSDHDGRIAVDSAPGAGTTFTVQLPAAASASVGGSPSEAEGRPS